VNLIFRELRDTQEVRRHYTQPSVLLKKYLHNCA